MRTMSCLRSLCKFALLIAALSCVADASAQQVFYTHTSGPSGDGFTWDFTPGGLNDLPDSETFFTPDGVDYFNSTGNSTFFDDSYLAAGNSSVIDGDAWWGNPSDNVFPQAGFGLFSTLNGGVSTFAFDFAWATSSFDASTTLELEVYGIDFSGEFVSTFLFVDLDEAFFAGPAFGNTLGAAGSISIDVIDLFDDSTSEPFDLIEEVYVNLPDVATLDGTGEFAIDNVSLDGAGGGVDGSNVFPSVNNGIDVTGSTLVSNVLINTAVIDQGVSVTNNGSDSTTYSTQILAGGALTPGAQAINQPIGSGETLFNASLTSFDPSAPSAEYTSDVRVINDSNPADADDDFTFSVRVHEHPQLSANNSTAVDVDGGAGLTLDNAAASSPTAFRAGARVESVETTGPFAVTGIAVDDNVLPDNGVAASVEFNRFGQITGVKAGTATIGSSMVSQNGFFLRNSEPIADVVWDLEFDHPDFLTDTAALNAAQGYAETVGVNDSVGAATLIAGASPNAQNVDMAIVANTGTNGLLATSATSLDFSDSSGLYVLEFTYDSQALSPGITEEDLRLLVLDEMTGLWDEAILGNSDSGAGGSLFLGSFSDFLAGLGGGVLDAADLSNFGLDTTNQRGWAILDHASIFALGVLQATLTGDYNEDGTVDMTDYLIWSSSFGSIGSGLAADGNGDGVVDAADYTVWRDNLGASLPTQSSSTAIPEPAAVVLLLCTLAMAPRPRWAN